MYEAAVVVENYCCLGESELCTLKKICRQSIVLEVYITFSAIAKAPEWAQENQLQVFLLDGERLLKLYFAVLLSSRIMTHENNEDITRSHRFCPHDSTGSQRWDASSQRSNESEMPENVMLDQSLPLCSLEAFGQQVWATVLGHCWQQPQLAALVSDLQRKNGFSACGGLQLSILKNH